MKNILIVSNPFGYGPTGQTIAMVEGLRSMFQKYNDSINIIFAGSGLCYELMKSVEGIQRIEADERDMTALATLIDSVSEIGLCIGVQNRFIPHVCRQKKIPCYFIDGLAWFWNEYPVDYLVADRVLWTDFPSLREKSNQYEKVSIIGDLTTKVDWQPRHKDPYILMCLGGQTNPLRPGLQHNYLRLVHEILKAVSESISSKFVVTTGGDACRFLSRLPATGREVKYVNVKHEEKMKLLSECSSFISVGGQSSTFESLASGVPTHFYLPSNLSQVALQIAFESHFVSWARYIEVPENFYSLSEKEAIDIIEGFSLDILHDSSMLELVCEDLIGGLSVGSGHLHSIYSDLQHEGYLSIYSNMKDDLK